METINIPTYKELKSGVALNVDRFCGYVTSLSFTLRLQSAEYRVEPKVNYILRKILADNDIQNNGLMRLLGSCTMEFLKQTTEHETNERELNTKQMKITFDETLKRSDKNELKVQIDKLEKLKKLHVNVMKTLIEKQKMLWKLNKKDIKTEELDKVKLDYIKNIGKEEKIRCEMKEVNKCINSSLKSKIIDRLEKSVDTLRWLAAEFTSYERTDEMLSRINGLDIAGITESIIESFCHRYRYAVPSDYFYFMDFDNYLLKEPQNSESEKLTLCMDLLEDKNMTGCLNLQNFRVNKKSGIRRFFSFHSKPGTQQATKTRNEIYSEILKEKIQKTPVYRC